MKRQTRGQDWDTGNGKPREQEIRQLKGKGGSETERETRRLMREGPIGRDTETQGKVDGDRCAGSSPGARSSVRKMESPKRQRSREGPARSQGRGGGWVP